MNGVLVDHGGGAGKPGESLGFTAVLNEDGRRIVINLKNGDKTPKVIAVAKEGPAISGFCPTTNGRIIYCLMEDDSERLFVTATGRPLIKAKSRRSRKRRLRQ